MGQNFMKNMHTRIIPTDKNNNVYYGPTTYTQAADAIRQDDTEPERVVSDLRTAGYTHLANRIAKNFVE